MTKYFLKRLALAVPTFLGITLVCFALVQAVPGGPVEQRLAAMRGLGSGGAAQTAAAGAHGGPVSAGDAVRKQLDEYFGLDKPLPARYVKWLVGDICGLRARSWHYPDKTAWELVRDRIPVSLWFGIPGFFLAYVVCIPLGIAKAVRRGTKFDAVSSAIVFAGYAVPSFALGMALKTLLCGTVEGLWDVLPLGGLESDGYAGMTRAAKVLDRARHMALPVLCYMSGAFAMLTLLVKNSLLDQLSSDYVRTVLAKGATLRRAIWGHALRVALVPVATGFGGVLTVFFAGSVVIERVFEIPGMGSLSLEALESRDYPVFLGLLATMSILGLAGQMLSDFCCVLVDPRIRLDK